MSQEGRTPPGHTNASGWGPEVLLYDVSVARRPRW
jgi:hypothetical protein